MTDDELKLMISEANNGDKSLAVSQEQFAQVLTKATNLWSSHKLSYYFIMSNREITPIDPFASPNTRTITGNSNSPYLRKRRTNAA